MIKKQKRFAVNYISFFGDRCGTKQRICASTRGRNEAVDPERLAQAVGFICITLRSLQPLVVTPCNDRCRVHARLEKFSERTSNAQGKFDGRRLISATSVKTSADFLELVSAGSALPFLRPILARWVGNGVGVPRKLKIQTAPAAIRRFAHFIRFAIFTVWLIDNRISLSVNFYALV